MVGKEIRLKAFMKTPAATMRTVCRSAAIVYLFSPGALDGSARALLRPVIEPSLRSEWLLLVATNKDLKSIAGIMTKLGKLSERWQKRLTISTNKTLGCTLS